MSIQLKRAVKQHAILLRKRASWSRSTLCTRFPFECFSTFGSECPFHKALGESCKDSKKLTRLILTNIREVSKLETKALKYCENVRFNIRKIRSIEPKINAMYKQTVEELQLKNIVPKYRVTVPWKNNEIKEKQR